MLHPEFQNIKVFTSAINWHVPQIMLRRLRRFDVYWIQTNNNQPTNQQTIMPNPYKLNAPLSS